MMAKQLVYLPKELQTLDALQTQINLLSVHSENGLKLGTLEHVMEETKNLPKKIQQINQAFTNLLPILRSMNDPSKDESRVSLAIEKMEIIKSELYIFESDINNSISEMKRKAGQLKKDIEEKQSRIGIKENEIKLKETQKKNTESEKYEAKRDLERHEKCANEYDSAHTGATAGAVGASVGGTVATVGLFFIPFVGPVLAAASAIATVTGTTVVSVKAEEYRAEMNKARNKIAETERKISSLETDIRSIKNTIDEENGKIKELNNEIDRLEKNIKWLSDLKESLNERGGLATFVNNFAEYLQNITTECGEMKRTVEHYHRTAAHHIKSIVRLETLNATKNISTECQEMQQTVEHDSIRAAYRRLETLNIRTKKRVENLEKSLKGGF